MMERDVIFCSCGSAEHQLLVWHDDEFADGYREVGLQPHLVTYQNIFKRIFVAIRYIFGYRSKYGHWDSIIIDSTNYLPLKRAVEFIEKKDL